MLSTILLTTALAHHYGFKGCIACGGRRRVAAADSQLCDEVTQFLSTHDLESLVKAVLEAGTSVANEEASMADAIGNWCYENGDGFHSLNDRRRIEDAWEAYDPTPLDDSDSGQLGSAEYINEMKLFANRAEAKRRLSSTARRLQATEETEEPSLPPFMWQQCAGYAYATAKLIRHLGSHGSLGADIIVMKLRGTAEDKIEGCAAIVNTVNSAIENDELPGFAIVPLSLDEGVLERPADEADPHEATVVAITDGIFGNLAGLTSITVGAGAVAGQVVYAMFEFCRSYKDLAITA